MFIKYIYIPIAIFFFFYNTYLPFIDPKNYTFLLEVLTAQTGHPNGKNLQWQRDGEPRKVGNVFQKENATQKVEPPGRG